MITVRRACLALGAVVSTAATALAPAVPAQGAVSTSWRVVFTHHYGTPTNHSTYEVVAATGQQDAWVLGVP